MADEGSINPTDLVVWGWNDVDIIGWDDAVKIGGSVSSEEDTGSINPT